MEEPKIIIPTKDHLFNMQEFLKLTPGNIINYTLLAIGLVITVVRFTQGIGAVSNLDDYQPWGMWIGFDLLCGVCLAAGGYFTTVACYVMGMKQFSSAARPAVLTAFLGYAFVVVALLYDLGHPLRLPYMFFFPGTTSVLFEVGLCVATYLTVIVPRLFNFTTLLSPGSLFALLLPFVLSCIFFGMMMSCFVRYRENVMLLVIFTSVPFLFMTGISWPLSNMPGFWQGVSYLIPSTFGIRGFLRISSEGATLQDISLEYHVLWIQAFVYLVFTCMVYRYQIMSTRKRVFAHMQDMREKIEQAKQKKLNKEP